MQRGSGGQAVVRDDTDRSLLLDVLAEQAQSHRVSLHAYVLTDNQFQLLLTPETADGVPEMMQAVGRSYVRVFNHRYDRLGTLWEGRYRSTLIQAERHLMSCMAFLDLEPVRQGLAEDPRTYPWSSHRHHVGHCHDRRIAPHALYWRLGNTPFAREAAYAEMVRRGLTRSQCDAMARAVWHGWVLGDAAFVADLQKHTDRRLAPARPGRPRLSARVPSA
jgi:putative transposase